MALTLVAYGAFFALLGVLLKRPVIPGLLFLYGWELLANLPGYLPRFTLTAWLRSLVHHRPAQEGLAGLFQQVLPAGQGLVVLVGVSSCSSRPPPGSFPRASTFSISEGTKPHDPQPPGRSRRPPSSSVLGVVAGLGALWLDPARAAVGPLPGRGPGAARRRPLRDGLRRQALHGEPVLRAVRHAARHAPGRPPRARGEDGDQPRARRRPDRDRGHERHGRGLPGARPGHGPLRPLQARPHAGDRGPR